MGDGGKDRNESSLAKGAGSRMTAVNTGGSEANIYLREMVHGEQQGVHRAK